MIKLKPLETIIKYWASSLPYKVRVHVFGSYLKDKPDRLVADIDISLEFLQPFSKDKRTLLWCDHHAAWESYLSKCTSEIIHLSLFEEADSPRMQQALKDGSKLLYEPEENQTEEKT